VFDRGTNLGTAQHSASEAHELLLTYRQIVSTLRHHSVQARPTPAQLLHGGLELHRLQHPPQLVVRVRTFVVSRQKQRWVKTFTAANLKPTFLQAEI
jgi:hypothetical protein